MSAFLFCAWPGVAIKNNLEEIGVSISWVVLVLKNNYAMKTKSRLIPVMAIVMVSSLVTSCFTEDPGPLQETEQHYSLTGFDRLEMGSAFCIQVEQGDFFSIRAVGDQRNIDDLDVFLEGSTLVIRYTNIRNRNHDTHLHIVMPVLHSANFSGASTSTIHGFSGTKGFDLFLSGASVSQLDINGRDLHVQISGASNLSVQGSGNKLQAEVSGASIVQAFSYQADDAILQATGASCVRTSVVGSLHALASGVSDILYRGDPVITATLSGGSTIRKD